MDKSLKLTVIVPEEHIKRLFMLGLPAVLTHCKVELSGEPVHWPYMPEINIPAEKMDALTPVIVNYAEKEDIKEPEREPRKLIKFSCMECGRINAALIERENNVYHITCRGCNYEYDFREADLTKAAYTCNECGKPNFYYTPEIENMGVTTDRCKCGNETKLSYSPSGGIYIAVEDE